MNTCSSNACISSCNTCSSADHNTAWLCLGIDTVMYRLYNIYGMYMHYVLYIYTAHYKEVSSYYDEFYKPRYDLLASLIIKEFDLKTNDTLVDFGGGTGAIAHLCWKRAGTKGLELVQEREGGGRGRGRREGGQGLHSFMQYICLSSLCAVIIML